jgi:hypothetical protein
LAAFPLTSQPERLKSVFVNQTPMEVENTWMHGDHLIFKFQGVDTISDAEKLAGAEVCIPFEQRAELHDDEIYQSDLIGCEVFDVAGRLLGVVTDFEETGLLGNAGTAEIEAVAVYPRVPKGIFASALDEPNGHTYVNPGDGNADVTVLDMTVLASLLFQNTPTGRLIEPDLKSFDVYEDLPPDVTTMPACPTAGNLFCDSFGSVYVRRRVVGTVPLLSDGSAHFAIPGGLPMVLHLPDDSESQQMNLPRWQREEMTFVPGEQVHQSFPSQFFNNLCAGCHQSIPGQAVDFALGPDFLTQASTVVAAVNEAAVDLTGPPSGRGQIMGPPANP